MTNLKLSSPVIEIPQIGPAKAAYLAKLGITHVRDFIYTFPRRYDDFSKITKISQLEEGEISTVKGKVAQVKTQWGFRGRQRLLRIFVELEDETGVLFIHWFNLRFLISQLTVGRELFVAGKVEANPTGKTKWRMRSPVVEFVDTKSQKVGTHTGRITPVYPETYGVTSRFLRYQVEKMLPLVQAVPEYLPAKIRRQNQLIGIHEAVREAHFPTSSEQLEQAKRRLRFDELFFLQLAAAVRRQQRQQRQALVIKNEPPVLDDFISSLSFSLTSAQRQACEEVINDLALSQPMNRLLQGDVGSGKSVVALAASYYVLQAGLKVLYLAPTEILARQQAQSFQQALGKNSVELLIGGISRGAKQKIKKRLSSEENFCVVGTHALFQADVVAQDLGLVIVDEQHRFGVAQRQALQNVAQSKKLPHLLSMTATPIPRTLSLTVFGDLDVSVLDELPPGRKEIITKIVSPSQRDEAIIHILEELHQGHQAYVISPLVEKSERLQVKSATETAEQMQQLFPNIAVGLLHGRLNSEEKDSILKQFAAGAIQLLVSTAVVEVGVNIPNATVMIIEGAERFGLSQLHQFRGRVGRSEHQSYCYLFPTEEAGTENRRLQALAATSDGFKIAEEDLKLRGPGELYGVSQSGFGTLQIASLLDYDAIKRTRTAAKELLALDPTLENHPILKKKAEQKNLVTHFE